MFECAYCSTGNGCGEREVERGRGGGRAEYTEGAKSMDFRVYTDAIDCGPRRNATPDSSRERDPARSRARAARRTRRWKIAARFVRRITDYSRVARYARLIPRGAAYAKSRRSSAKPTFRIDSRTVSWKIPAIPTPPLALETHAPRRLGDGASYDGRNCEEIDDRAGRDRKHPGKGKLQSLQSGIADYRARERGLSHRVRARAASNYEEKVTISTSRTIDGSRVSVGYSRPLGLGRGRAADRKRVKERVDSPSVCERMIYRREKLNYPPLSAALKLKVVCVRSTIETRERIDFRGR